MSAREFDDWVAFYNVEPWGSYRDNLHAGIIASTIANVAPGRKRKAMTVSDFILKTTSESKATETQRSLAALRALARKPK